MKEKYVRFRIEINGSDTGTQLNNNFVTKHLVITVFKKIIFLYNYFKFFFSKFIQIRTMDP